MRSSPVKSEKKPLKATKRAYTIKKTKLAEMKTSIRDTISETISFVIKGKLTPIKPILIDNKFDIIGSTKRKIHHCGRIMKTRNSKINQKAGKQITKKPKQKSKDKTKVQSETAKKISAQNSIKKSPDTNTQSPKDTKKTTKSETSPKTVKRKVTVKTEKPKKVETPKTKKVAAKKPKKPPQSEPVPDQKKIQEQALQETQIQNEDEIKKQQTIEELLKQVNEELIENKKANKIKKQKAKAKKIEEFKTEKLNPKQKQDSKEKLDFKEKQESKENSDLQQTLEVIENVDAKPKLNEQNKKKKATDKKTSEQPTEIDKPVSLNEIPDEITLKELSEINSVLPAEDIKMEQLSEEETGKKPKKKTYKKLKTKPKMTIMKKRVISKNKDQQEDNKCTTKLFGFWNGPKRHRVASLNALAKVHCLYENETRGNILDVIEENSKLEYNPKRDAAKTLSIKKEYEDTDPESPSSPLPTRTLRSVPGLRGAGKHWDMHDSSSSSEENDEESVEEFPVRHIKREKDPKPKTENTEVKTGNKERKKRRKRSELMMDLKDMVVRKRMASLNASAILAASYSVEKRQTKTAKSDSDSDSYDGSSEDYFAASDNDIKHEDEMKKEEDRKLIEVHTTPNKKVAVILNQDTDVTITGVYVNSTTRSTHHEGYCSIAGMQYRISATSHTQTAATAVATETLLQQSSSSGPDNVSIPTPL